MLTEQSAADAVAQWVGDVCGIPADRRFAYPQSMKTAELPDVAAAVVEARTQRGADVEDFPLATVEGRFLSVFVVEFSIMVEQGDDENEAAAAQTSVYGFAAQIRESLIADPTLRSQLDPTAGEFASPLIVFDFRQPFVEYEDDTRGRVTPGTVRLAQAIAEPG